MWARDYEHARVVAYELRDIFGSDNFYLETMHHPGVERHDEIQKGIVDLARQTGIPLVATQGSYYISREDKEAHKTLLAIQQGHTAANKTRFITEDDFSFIDGRRAASYFQNMPDAIENTMKIANECQVDLTPSEWLFPNIETVDNLSHYQQLRNYVYDGIDGRGLKKTKEVVDRIVGSWGNLILRLRWWVRRLLTHVGLTDHFQLE